MDSSPERPVLVLIQGDKPGAMWELDPTRVTSIGRSSRNQVQLLELSVSRFHCEIAFSNGFWYVSDLNSRKGTLLNGKGVETREVLKQGDVVRISGSLLRFTDAGELENIIVDPEDYGGVNGIEMLREHSVREALERELIHEKGGRIRAVVDGVRGLARHTALPLFVAVLCLAVSYALLSEAGSRAEERREEIIRRGARAEHDLAAVMLKIEAHRRDSAGCAEILDDLARIVREYGEFPEAGRAAEKFADFEKHCFQKAMNTVYGYVLAGDLDAAEEKLAEAESRIYNGGMRRVIQLKRERIGRLRGLPESGPGVRVQ